MMEINKPIAALLIIVFFMILRWFFVRINKSKQKAEKKKKDNFNINHRVREELTLYHKNPHFCPKQSAYYE